MSNPYPWIKDSQYGTTPSVTGYLEVTSTNGLYLNSKNILVTNGQVTATTFNGALTGNATNATTATNIAGGSGGEIPYQSSANTTALLANGTAGQVLQSNGTTAPPSWVNAGATSQIIYATSSPYSVSAGVNNQQLTIINDITPVSPDYKQLGTSGANNTTNAIATDNTQLYLGGDFTSVNGTSVNLVAKVNTSGTVTDTLNGGISPISGSVKCLNYLSTNTSLYAGGTFTAAAASLGPTLNNIGYYNASTWKTMGSGINPGLGSQVNAIESSPFSTYLYCGGNFTTDSNLNDMPYITKYHRDYNVFAPLQDPDITPYGVNGQVKSIDCDSNAGYIYVGGSFSIVGEINATNVARYNINTNIWEALSGVSTTSDGTNLIEVGGQGTVGTGVYAVYWASNIGRLYVAGSFSYVQSSQITATNVAYWTPGAGGLGTWNALTSSAGGEGLSGGEVCTIAYDDTTGLVYFGGLFSSALSGGSFIQVNNVAVWDPNNLSWGGLGGNGGIGTNGKVLTMIWCTGLPDIGSGLILGGEFQTIDGNNIQANYLGIWAPVGTGTWYPINQNDQGQNLNQNPGVNSYVNALAWDNAKLYIGGNFTQVNYSASDGSFQTYDYPYMVIWQPSSIDSNNPPMANGSWNNAVTSMNASVNSLHYNAATSRVFAGGDFTNASNTQANYAAYWNGSFWSSIGNGLNSPVYSINYYSPSSFIFCGGSFTLANESNVSNSNIQTNYIAYYNEGNTSWYPLMETILPYGVKIANISTTRIYAVAYDSNSNMIYVGGDFRNAGGIYANNIAMYNIGSNIWYPLIQSSTQINGVDNIVRALYFDGGSQLYVGGDFIKAGGIQVNYIAKWDGSGAWSVLNDNSTGSFGTNGPVYCITYYYPYVYIGGAFSAVGGSVTATNVASWDISNIVWSALYNSSSNEGVDGTVYAILHNYSGIFGTAVIIGGSFSTAGGSSASNVVVWGNQTGPYEYYPLFSDYTQSSQGTNGPVYALARSTYDTNILYVGGSFSEVSGTNYFPYIASWKWSGANYGSWASLGDNSINGIVRTLVCDNNYNLYLGGEFYEAKIDGSTNPTPVNFLLVYPEPNGKYNTLPTASSTSGTIKGSNANGALGYVYSLCYNSSNTYLIVGGEFQYVYNSSQPSIKTKNIAIINTSANTWIKTPSPIPKLNERVFAIKYYNSTDIFVGGRFTGLSSGQQQLNYIARWNISDNLWYPIVENNPIPQNNMNGVDYDVYAFAFEGTTTNLYVGGAFATGGGKTLNNIAKLTNATTITPTWVTFPDAINPIYLGVNSSVRSIYFSGGNAYICGDFITAGAGTNTTPLFRVAKIDSSNQIVQIKNSSGTHCGMNNPVYSNVYINPNIYFGGAFTNTAPTANLSMSNISYFSSSTVVTPLTITTPTSGFLDTETAAGTIYSTITIPTRYKLTNLIYNLSLNVWLEAYRSTGVITNTGIGIINPLSIGSNNTLTIDFQNFQEGTTELTTPGTGASGETVTINNFSFTNAKSQGQYTIILGIVNSINNAQLILNILSPVSSIYRCNFSNISVTTENNYNSQKNPKFIILTVTYDSINDKYFIAGSGFNN